MNRGKDAQAGFSVRDIPLDQIEVVERLRPTDAERVEALAEDIAERGLRLPVEIAETPKGKRAYRLVAGAHRLEVCRMLGHATIAARIVAGSELELRRDEIMENIARNELSTLDEARFLAELKRVEQALSGARHGGDRRSPEVQADQDVKMTSWYEVMGKIRRKSGVTIQKYVAIADRLDPKVAMRLRGTAFEDRRQELEALGKYGASVQNRIADQLLAETNAAPTVKSAVKRIEGQPAASEDTAADKAFKKLLDAWNRAPGPVQKSFLRAIGATRKAGTDG